MRASQAFNAGSIPVTRSNLSFVFTPNFLLFFENILFLSTYLQYFLSIFGFWILTDAVFYAIIRYICTKNEHGGSDGAEKRYAKTER